MGNWALAQAQALKRAGVEIEVVSFTAWVPRLLAHSSGAQAYADCPEQHLWGELHAHIIPVGVCIPTALVGTGGSVIRLPSYGSVGSA